MLITTWRLCEAVCAGSQLSRQQRPDLLSKQHGPRRGDSLGNEIFSLLGILFEWAALNKLRGSQMLCLCDPLPPEGFGGAGWGAATDLVLFTVIHVEGRSFVCSPHTTDTQ